MAEEYDGRLRSYRLRVCSRGPERSPAIAHAAEGDYQIYPTPHTVTYANGEVPLSDTITTVVEDGIDADTVTRMNETLRTSKGSRPLRALRFPQAKVKHRCLWVLRAPRVRLTVNYREARKGG